MSEDMIETETLQQRPNFFKRLLDLYSWENIKNNGWKWGAGLIISTLCIVMLIVSFIWDDEPDLFNVRAVAEEKAQRHNEKLVPGYVTTHTLMYVAQKMMDKRGGYLSNDIMPPSVFMDNIPNWEFGVLTQVRDFAKALRNDLSRSQTQSLEDKDLKEGEPKFNIDNSSWLMPAAESEYGEAIDFVENYLHRIASIEDDDGQFFSRADNLRDWLKTVEKRLGNLSQRLSASVGQRRVNTDLAGDSEAKQSTPTAGEMKVRTPWLKIDDVFYEARGTSWALIHLLRAVEYDFQEVLQKKNALISLRQIIRELEATQETIWSPMVLNGTDFGFFANHSLVMSSYIARANAGIIDLRDLLKQG